AIGVHANKYNEEGSNNTIIGYLAGGKTQFHNKFGNVFLGYQAGYNDTTDNKLYIENSNSSTPLIWGDFANDTVRINGDFQVTGDWVGLEINKLNDGKTGGNSVFLGSGAGANDDGTDNKNVAVGINALTSNTTGSGNTAIGWKALYSDTTGYWNTATGFIALYENTTGNINTANGYAALYENTTGSGNTAIGKEALGENTTGQGNTAIGVHANKYNEEGSNNTIIGYLAGGKTQFHNKSGNVFLGFMAGYNETGSYKLYIDNSDITTPLIYGEFDNDILAFNANVGIGTTIPSVKLDVRGSAPDDGVKLNIGNSDDSHRLTFYSGHENDPNPFIHWKAGDPLRFTTDEGGWSEKMRITSEGSVGIGTTNPYAKLDVRGSNPDDGAIIRTGNSDGSHRLTFFPGRENDPNPFIQWKEGDPLRFSTDEGGWSEKMRITSEGSVGIGTQSPHASAELEVASNDKGLLMPRMTRAEIEAIASPADGLTVYNTNDKHFYFFDGGANIWKEIAIGAGTINAGCGNITDSDGNTYNTVLIGSRCWMKENLATTKYNDGTGIPLVTDNTAWHFLTTPGYCWYDNDSATNGYTYGALYNWYTVNTGNLCPTGWHVPTDGEWTHLTNYLGGVTYAGGKLKETGTTHWNPPNTGATNETGFTALPGGRRDYYGTFSYIGNYGSWWSATEWGTGVALFRRMSYNQYGVYSMDDWAVSGFSVRCLKD
ncbi:MAG: fibrobacter succinogenes major paralogous domain-containing protein, partial [Bacteroidales bacterium]|nr:fibrobacter succinogenes major paralogous domain-containing protein [Bacteroidales bacterium]